MAAEIAMAESGGNPNATDHDSNGTVDRRSIPDKFHLAAARLCMTRWGTRRRPCQSAVVAVTGSRGSPGNWAIPGEVLAAHRLQVREAILPDLHRVLEAAQWLTPAGSPESTAGSRSTPNARISSSRSTWTRVTR